MIRMRVRFGVASTILAVVLVCVCVVSGCDDNNTLAPFEPEITNAPDSFQLQATGVQRVSTTLNYQWQNSGSQANVDHSTTTGAGDAKLTIRDAADEVVYDKGLVPSLSDTTSTGASGTWKLQVVLTDYSGTLNFRVQKRD
jgi:hypothetical protein